MTARAPGPGSGSTTTVRPGNWRLSVVVPGAIVAGVCIVGGVTGLMSGGQPVEAVGA